VKDPSLLRFLVDMRGEDATDKQLRDDLMVSHGWVVGVACLGGWMGGRVGGRGTTELSVCQSGGMGWCVG